MFRWSYLLVLVILSLALSACGPHWRGHHHDHGPCMHKCDKPCAMKCDRPCGMKGEQAQ